MLHFSLFFSFVNFPCCPCSSASISSRTKLHQEWNLAVAEKLVSNVILVLQIFPQPVQHRASLLLLWITCENAPKAYLINDGPVVHETSPELAQNLVLGVILVWGNENAFQAIVNEALKRVFELAVGVGIFELKQVEITALFIEIKTIYAVIVAAKGHLVDRFFSQHIVLPLKVEQPEVILADPFRMLI